MIINNYKAINQNQWKINGINAIVIRTNDKFNQIIGSIIWLCKIIDSCLVLIVTINLQSEIGVHIQHLTVISKV